MVKYDLMDQIKQILNYTLQGKISAGSSRPFQVSDECFIKKTSTFGKKEFHVERIVLVFEDRVNKKFLK